MSQLKSEKAAKAALARSYDRIAQVAREAAAREVERLNQAVKAAVRARVGGAETKSEATGPVAGR